MGFFVFEWDCTKESTSPLRVATRREWEHNSFVDLNIRQSLSHLYLLTPILSTKCSLGTFDFGPVLVEEFQFSVLIHSDPCAPATIADPCPHIITQGCLSCLRSTMKTLSLLMHVGWDEHTRSRSRSGSRMIPTASVVVGLLFWKQ